MKAAPRLSFLALALLLTGCAVPQGDMAGKASPRMKRGWTASGSHLSGPVAIDADQMARAAAVPVDVYQAAKAGKRVLAEKQDGDTLYFATETYSDGQWSALVRKCQVPTGAATTGAPVPVTSPPPADVPQL